MICDIMPYWYIINGPDRRSGESVLIRGMEEGMDTKMTRRDFVLTGAAAGAVAGLNPSMTGLAQSRGSRPLVVSSANGLKATEKAMEMIRAGADTLDAVFKK